MNWKFGRCLYLRVALLFSTLLWTSSSQFPGAPGSDPWGHRPNDPEYEKAWHLFSHVPPNHLGRLSTKEQEMGSGMSVDKAWQLHTGTPDTLIAVIDSGVYWDSADIRERIFLNTKELPLPQNATTYDSNHDGRVSAADYSHDTRVVDQNHNGVVDAEDIIVAFSNGIDDDGNGFIDDISGWDFHEHDNNPGDRVEFGHGTGEAKDSVAAVNNGIGGAGGCPNCSVVFLRANDSFVVDGNAFTGAVSYATNIGAKIIQEALGSLNHNSAMQKAIDYAWQKNVLIIGSAADENSYHHNFPATLDPIVYVNALRYNTLKVEEATSFLAFNNCSNFGARVDVAAAGISCSSEATGNLSGIAALASSYASSLGKSLTAGELASLIKTTAADVNLGSNASDPSRHATWQGWDKISGYGRVNAYNILRAIQNDEIPPSARIVTPRWFELFRQRPTLKIPVVIETGLPRSGKLRVKLEVARGVETSASEWRLLKDSGDVTTKQDGLFTEVSLQDLAFLKPNTVDGPEYKNAYTIRLTVDNLTGQTAEARRTIYVFDDPGLAIQFPVDLKASGESSGLFADLNGDGKDEFVVADSAGYVHAFQYQGHELSGFPVAASAVSAYATSSVTPITGVFHSAIYAPIAVADLDGDGDLEIVTASLEGDISVINHDGTLEKGSPFKLPFPSMELANKQQVIAPGIFASPVLADIDRDGLLEIIVVSADGQLYVFDRFGQSRVGFPVPILEEGRLAKLMSSPAVYDVNRDGILDFVMGSNHVRSAAGTVFAIDGRGSLGPQLNVAGFPAKIPLFRDDLLPTVGTGIPTAPIIGDFNYDGIPEILIHGFAGKPYMISMSGQIQGSLSLTLPPQSGSIIDQTFVAGFGNPAAADIDGLGRLFPTVLGTSSRIFVSLANGGQRVPYDNLVGVWNGSLGTLSPSFPRKIEDLPLLTSPVAADITGDGRDEIIAGTGGYFLHAFSHDGEVRGFPTFTGGWILGSPAVGDMNGDGKREIGVTTREGYAFIWRTSGITNSLRATWPTFKGNNARTGAAYERR